MQHQFFQLPTPYVATAPHTELLAQPYHIHLWTPPSQHAVPLLLLLDGDWIHNHVQQFLQRQPRPLNYAIATLGFGLARPEARQRRSFEYTPIPPAPHPAVDPRVPNWLAGGAPALLHTIQTRLLPLLNQHAVIHPQRLGLFGHSYGGLFVLWALLQQPELFQHYISASPSLWWYHPFMQQHASHLPPLSTRLQLDLLIGEQEQWRPKPATPDAPRPAGIPTLGFLQAFLQHLPRSSQLKQQLRLYPEADHGAMLGLATEFALTEFMA